MIVETEHPDAPAGYPIAHFGLCIEIVGLVTEVIAGVGAKPGADVFDCTEDCACIVGTAKPRLPGPGDAVVHRRDSITDRLTVTLGQRDIDRKRNARPRHQLAFESIRMNVDDAGQHQKAGCINAAAISGFGSNSCNQPLAFADIDLGRRQFTAHQRRSALDAHKLVLRRMQWFWWAERLGLCVYRETAPRLAHENPQGPREAGHAASPTRPRPASGPQYQR